MAISSSSVLVMGTERKVGQNGLRRNQKAIRGWELDRWLKKNKIHGRRNKKLGGRGQSL